MTESTVSDLERLGFDAAQEVTGKDAVKQVEVASGEDLFERPAYFFSFLIDQGLARQRAGLVRIRLMQKLLDELTARDDGHLPVIQILNQEDWDKRSVA